MARRISSSQLRSKLRQLQTKARQAEAAQRRAVQKINQEIRKENQRRRDAVNKYNQAVRQCNSRLRTHQQRLKTELARLNSRTSHSSQVTLRTSVETVHQAYLRYERAAGADPAHAEFLDLAEREDANNVAVVNTLLDDEEGTAPAPGPLQTSIITTELRSLSLDLDARWRGAVYALSPQNPDAARHFCASAREIFTQLLHMNASNEQVLDAMPSCEKTDKGHPTRRARISFILRRKGLHLDALEDFVEHNVNNVLQLFDVLNKGAHGPAGQYSPAKLGAIKTRAEEALLFMARLVA